MPVIISDVLCYERGKEDTIQVTFFHSRVIDLRTGFIGVVTLRHVKTRLNHTQGCIGMGIEGEYFFMYGECPLDQLFFGFCLFLLGAAAE